MKVKENISNFWNENGRHIVLLVGTAVVFISGYAFGTSINSLETKLGIRRCVEQGTLQLNTQVDGVKVEVSIDEWCKQFMELIKK